MSLRLRHVARFVRGAGFPHDQQGVDEGDLPFYKVGDLSRRGNEVFLRSCANWISVTTATVLRARTVPAGSVLLPKIGAALLGGVRRITTERSVFDNNVLGIVPVSIESRYLRYWLSTIDLAELANPGPVPSLNEGWLLDLEVPEPDYGSQFVIAEYLDAETARIDALIAKKRRMVSLLGERLSERIDRLVWGAVSGSGAESDAQDDRGWPALAVVVDITEGQVDPEEQPYCDMPLVAPNHIEGGTGRLLSEATAAEQGAISGKYLCQPGEIIYSKIRPALRKACVATKPCLTSADMYPIRPHAELHANYLLYVLLSGRFTDLAVLESQRVAMPKINRDALGRIRIPMPPLHIQRSIASAAEALSHWTARTLDALHRQIELLLEHRQALIAAAVMGELEIRGVAA